jgi:hypothetical protein
VECRVSVRVRVVQFLLISALVLTAATSRADVAVVLVADKDSPIESISSLDIRKVYFGISVTIGGNIVRGLRRRDDERLNQIFLQSVIAMSERSYERRLLSLVLKFGTPRPAEVDSRDELLELLQNHSSSVAYMWKSEAESDSRVKIIRVLWQEN